ncbi:SRPBCC family protein [Mycobacterium ostraviense]|uniref:SRPBCC family protein n=1 Tax=Mycobacterium ostraviense TaxID=2738409 RepID=UPI001E5381B2|nr:SRPBCC family protein [Mycobacterium ostraviense]UGT92519.1 SRPBCC family protein [Mycobacterium ostraviense]
MKVDVTSEILIARPRAEVFAYDCDPDNATPWYANIRSAQWKSSKPLVIGSQLAFTARFLGRSLSYTYEVVDLQPGARFVMRTPEGPFRMQTTYLWEDGPNGTTKMSLPTG